MTHQETVRALRLAHARQMEIFYRLSKTKEVYWTQYWLERASKTHQQLLDLGEVAI